MPAEKIYVSKSIQECSWLQGLEGECDSSHLSFLHRYFTGERPRGGGDGALYVADTAPTLEGIEMDYGIRMLSCRKIAADTVYLRVSNIVMPCHGFIPTGGIKGNPEGYTIHSHVPMDDTHSLRYNIHFRRNRPIEPEERQHEDEIGPDFLKIRNCKTTISSTGKSRSAKTSPAWDRSSWCTTPAPPKPWGRSTTARKNIWASAT